MDGHHIRFTRHVVTGETRATCMCGASIAGDRLTCAEWANHHLDKRGLDELRPLPPGKSGFVSGLADTRKKM